MELLLPFAMLAVLALPFALDLLRHELDRQQVCAAARAFGVTITANFLTAPCTRCEQRDMGLLSVNANGSAIHYECRHCQKKLYAAAASPDACEAVPRYQLFQGLLTAFNRRYTTRRIAIDIVFQTSEAARGITP